MPSLHHDEPTTIDLHGAKPIDFMASKPDEVREDLRQSGLVMAKWYAMVSGGGATLLSVMSAIQYSQPTGFASFGERLSMRRSIEMALGLALTAFGSWRRYRRLKSEAPPRVGP